MTSSESLRPLEELKMRLEEMPGGMGTHQWLSLAEDAIRLAEIYRKIAAKFGDALDGREPNANDYRTVDKEASRLFKGEDGV